MSWLAKSRRPSVVGLAVADGTLRAAHAARAKNAIAIVRTKTAPLSLDLLHPEAELVGREIRNHLEAAHIRERHCVVVIPPSWVMSQHTRVPELAEDDLASLLAIEAEKGFPCDPEELQIARSTGQSAAGAYVTQLAIRQEQLARLAAVLKSAGLKSASFTLGLDALPGAIPPAGEGRITLVIEPKGATLLIAAGGGIAGFRTFEATIESEAGEHVLNGAALARELRISFEQVEPELRREIRQLQLLGDDRIARQLEEILRDWAKDAGLTMQSNAGARLPVAEEIVEAAATRHLRVGPAKLEFLPPRPSRWAQLMARYSSKRLATAGFAAAAAVVLVLAAFGWQEYRRWSLRNEWDGMAAQVKDLDAITGKIREFRPWYDTSYRNLTIMKRVVECFPDNGTVNAKSFEIHASNISVTGSARDNASFLHTLDLLRQVKEVQGLKVEQIRGTPAQFTFTFRWNANPGT